MIRTPTRSIRASAMRVRTTTPNIVPATTNGRRACSRSRPSDGKIKWGFQYTPNDPYDFDEISEHPIINAKVNGEDRKLVVHAARNGFYYALDRTNGSFVTGKQYVDQLNWTTGLDPKTGRPLNYDPTKDVQVYTPGSHGLRASGPESDLPVAHRRQELAARRLQSGAQSDVTSQQSRAATRSRRRSRRASSTRAAPCGRATGLPAADPSRAKSATEPQGNRSGDRRDQGEGEACRIRTMAARWRPRAISCSTAMSTGHSPPMMPRP